MYKVFFKSLFVVFLVSTFIGCSTTRNVKVRAFKEDKQRVDQEYQGKVGNWQNSPEVMKSESKPTRRVYFLEFSKEPTDASFVINQANQNAQVTQSTDANVSNQQSNNAQEIENKPVEVEKVQKVERRKLDIPTFDEEQESAQSVKIKKTVVSSVVNSDGETFTDYTVEKDDTLQKISKKFYNTNTKWTKIYEANKDILKTPDFIKPGIVIKVPVEQN